MLDIFFVKKMLYQLINVLVLWFNIALIAIVKFKISKILRIFNFKLFFFFWFLEVFSVLFSVCMWTSLLNGLKRKGAFREY